MYPIVILQNTVDIEKKISEAPDSAYEIGVFIGYLIPFILLIGMAYIMFYAAKKRQDK